MHACNTPSEFRSAPEGGGVVVVLFCSSFFFFSFHESDNRQLTGRRPGLLLRLRAATSKMRCRRVFPSPSPHAAAGRPRPAGAGSEQLVAKASVHGPDSFTLDTWQGQGGLDRRLGQSLQSAPFLLPAPTHHTLTRLVVFVVVVGMRKTREVGGVGVWQS